MKRAGVLLLFLANPIYWWISWRLQWPAGLAVPFFWSSATVHLVVDVFVDQGQAARFLSRRAIITLDVVVILLGLVLLVPKSYWGNS